MHAIITAVGLSLVLGTPAMAEIRLEHGVRVHRGAVPASADDTVGARAAQKGVRRMVKLDRRYGSGEASHTAMRPLWLVPLRPTAWR